MFNVAVINIKDIGKYALKIIAIILLIAFATIFFKNNQLQQENTINYAFLECFHLTLPTARTIEINEKDNESILEHLINI